MHLRLLTVEPQGMCECVTHTDRNRLACLLACLHGRELLCRQIHKLCDAVRLWFLPRLGICSTTFVAVLGDAQVVLEDVETADGFNFSDIP